MRILIIDDEADAAAALMDNLELAGYDCDTAASAAAALNLCEQHDYGVIFLDLGLPDRSGLHLLPDIQHRNPEAQIVVLTANQSINAAVDAVNHGASFYLLKPVDVPPVLRMVRMAEADLKRRREITFQNLVLDNVQESVVTIDLDRKVTYWNHGAETLYGWTAAEMMGQLVDRLIPGDEDILRDISPEGAVSEVEVIRRRRDESTVEVEERKHTLRDTGGNTIGFLIFSRDITERKEAERSIEEVRRREHTIAVTFQRALLPDIPNHRPGLEIGSLYSPAWKEADVGGDFYDLMSLPDSRTGILLGDVSGKGLSAGVLMSRIRHVIDAYAAEDDRPQEVLARANRHLATNIPEERFVTLFLAIFNPADRSLSYASAGHEPAILVRTNGNVDMLEPTGPMVGLDMGLEFDCAQMEFNPGDLLLVYTDGATEVGSRDNFLGTQGLIGLVTQFAHLPPSEIVESLHQQILELSGGMAQDDLAMLCLRATGKIG